MQSRIEIEVDELRKIVIGLDRAAETIIRGEMRRRTHTGINPPRDVESLEDLATDADLAVQAAEDALEQYLNHSEAPPGELPANVMDPNLASFEEMLVGSNIDKAAEVVLQYRHAIHGV